MNIFYLDRNPNICAEYHTDRHVVKMIVEYAQILSTAHRVLDGKLVNKKFVFDDNRDTQYYKATHVNHPSTVWARQNKENYIWLALLFSALCEEYTFRYGKVHKTWIERYPYLLRLPKNIPDGTFTEPTPAMPDEYIVVGDVIQSYQNYYNGAKRHLFAWKNRPIPHWIIDNQ